MRRPSATWLAISAGLLLLGVAAWLLSFKERTIELPPPGTPMPHGTSQRPYLDEYQPAFDALDTLIQGGQHDTALSNAIGIFKLDENDCADYRLEPIQASDEEGEEVIAQTNFDQIVRLDPEREAFSSARKLFLTLAHESEHCTQHQRLYEDTIALEPRLQPLKRFLPQLSDLATLAEVAAQSQEGHAEAAQRFQSESARLGVPFSEAELLELERLLSLELSRYAGWLRELFEIDATFQLVEMNVDEGDFQRRYLEIAMHRLLRRRGIEAGTSADVACAMEKALPPETRRYYEAVCRRALKLLK
jgi:hypothetical protein